jgi:hypothetical protein
MTQAARIPQANISRRRLFGIAVGAGAYGLLGTKAAAMPGPPAPPVVSFHADAPYIDLSGTAKPFTSRISTDWTAGLDHEALLRLGQYV